MGKLLMRRRGMVLPNKDDGYSFKWLKGYEYNNTGELVVSSNANYSEPIELIDGDIIRVSILPKGKAFWTKGVQFNNSGVFINKRNEGNSYSDWIQNIVGAEGRKFAFSYINQPQRESDYELLYLGNTSDLRPSTDIPSGYESVVFGQDSHTVGFVRTTTANNVQYVTVEIGRLPSTNVIAPDGLTKDSTTITSKYLLTVAYYTTTWAGSNIIGMHFPVPLIGGNTLADVLAYLQTHRIEFYVKS